MENLGQHRPEVNSLEDRFNNQESNKDHWQDVRERVAIVAMQGLLVHSGDACTESFITKLSIIYADALIEKLKGE